MRARNNPVRQILSWVSTLLRSDSSYRRKTKNQVLADLREYSEYGEGNPNVTAGEKLSDSLSDSTQFDFIGFVPNISYIKEKGPQDHLEALWVHPFGSETLLFKHSSLPILILMNPNIRLNESLVGEMIQNGQQPPQQGISG